MRNDRSRTGEGTENGSMGEIEMWAKMTFESFVGEYLEISKMWIATFIHYSIHNNQERNELQRTLYC